MPAEEIIVLANSRKLGGRCVAGLSTRSGEWVRPVSARQHGELELSDCRVGGRLSRELDVVRFGYKRRLDNPAQPENVLIDGEAWQLVESLDPAGAYARLQPCISRERQLLGNRGKAVPESVAAEGVDASLVLVEPEAEVAFSMTSARGLKPKALFTFSGTEYELTITDYVVAPRIRALGEGTFDVADLGFPTPTKILLTVSLAEPSNGWCTKLVAGVLLLPA